MIYHMSTKTFVQDFITRIDTEDVLRYQYVVISSGVKADKSLENVVKMSMLMPADRICSDYMNGSLDEEAFFTEYYSQLIGDSVSLAMCGFIVEESIKRGDVIIIYGPNENGQIPYMKVIEDLFMNEFGHPIYDFLDVICGKIVTQNVNEKKCLKRAKKIIDKSKTDSFNNSMNLVARHEYISGLGKKELRKLLRKNDIPYDDLSKSDMMDILFTVFDCRIDEG